MSDRVAFHSSKSVFDIVDLSTFIMDQLNHQRKKCQFCDATIISRDGKSFYAHKAVLAASSLFFQNSIAEIQNANRCKNDENIILQLTTISSDALESLLNMIYTSQLDVTESNIIEIQLAANYLDLKQAMSLCQQLLRFCDPTTSGRFAELHSKTPETTCISPGGNDIVESVAFQNDSSSVNGKDDAAYNDQIPNEASIGKNAPHSRSRLSSQESSDCRVDSDHSCIHSRHSAASTAQLQSTLSLRGASSERKTLPLVPPLAPAIVVPHIAHSQASSPFEMPGIMVHAPLSLCSYVPALHDWKRLHDCGLLSNSSLLHLYGQPNHCPDPKNASAPQKTSDGKLLHDPLANSDARHGNKETNAAVSTPVIDETERATTANVTTETPSPSKEDNNSKESARPCGRSFPCHLCDSRFPSKAGLSVHLRSHTGERPYKCSICGKTFTQLGHVQRHQKVHTGEKPFQCTWCNARVRDKASMHYHILAHKGIKPFRCDQCEAKFTKRSSLVKHKNVHTGKFLYHCSQCKASFREKASLSRHRRCQHTSNGSQDQETS